PTLFRSGLVYQTPGCAAHFHHKLLILLAHGVQMHLMTQLTQLFLPKLSILLPGEYPERQLASQLTPGDEETVDALLLQCRELDHGVPFASHHRHHQPIVGATDHLPWLNLRGDIQSKQTLTQLLSLPHRLELTQPDA